jgi:hypothetical protein
LLTLKQDPTTKQTLEGLLPADVRSGPNSAQALGYYPSVIGKNTFTMVHIGTGDTYTEFNFDTSSKI